MRGVLVVFVLLLCGHAAFADDAPYSVRVPAEWTQATPEDSAVEWHKNAEARAFAVTRPVNRKNAMRGLSRRQFEQNLIARTSEPFEAAGFELAGSKRLRGPHPAVELVLKKADKTTLRIRVYALAEQLVSVGARVYPEATAATRREADAIVTSARVR